MRVRMVVEVVLFMLYLQLALYLFLKQGPSADESEESCLVILHKTPSPLPLSSSATPASSPSSSPSPAAATPSSTPSHIPPPSPIYVNVPVPVPVPVPMGPAPIPVLPHDRFQPQHNSTRSQYPRQSIAVVTSYFRRPNENFGDYDRLFQEHVDRSMRYTHLHSYAFFLETSHWQTKDFNKAVWSKLPAVWNHLPHYDWVLWIDADAMFANFDITIDEVLARAEEQFHINENGKDFLVAKDMNGLNFGVFLIRNTPWANGFLRRAWGMLGRPDIQQEQHAVQTLLRTNPEDNQHTQYIPQRWINSYVWDVIRQYHLSAQQVKDGKYEPGDFIVHTPGLSIKDKLAAISKDLSPERPDINIAPGQSIHWGLAVQPFKVEG